MIPHNTLAVFRFELRRSLTVSRVGVWLLLVLFPVFIVSVMGYYEEAFDAGAFGPPDRPTLTFTLPAQKYGEVHVAIYERGRRRTATIRLGEGPQRREVRGVRIPRNLSPNDLEPFLEQVLEAEIVGATQPPPRPESGIPVTVWGAVLFGLIPEVITLFGLLLWVTPVVQAELEGRTWIYLAVRPRGRVSVLLGKYLTAVTWTAAAGCTSATLCVLLTRSDESLSLWLSLMAMVALACLGYGALYSLIGVLLQRRAMVIAVAYTLIFEFLVSFIPAVINQFTVQYRLRNLFVQCMGWSQMLTSRGEGVFLGDEPAWQHVALLGIYTLALLGVATQVIQRKEYVTAAEA